MTKESKPSNNTRTCTHFICRPFLIWWPTLANVHSCFIFAYHLLHWISTSFCTALNDNHRKLYECLGKEKICAAILWNSTMIALYSCVGPWFFWCVLQIWARMLFHVTDTNTALQSWAGGRGLWACWECCLCLCNCSHLFALGVLMWEVFSEGKMPYENRTNGEVVEEINAGFRLYKPKLASKAIYEVMSHCWSMVSISLRKHCFPTRALSPWVFRRVYTSHVNMRYSAGDEAHCSYYLC